MNRMDAKKWQPTPIVKKFHGRRDLQNNNNNNIKTETFGMLKSLWTIKPVFLDTVVTIDCMVSPTKLAAKNRSLWISTGISEEQEKTSKLTEEQCNTYQVRR